jgi:hypothetical protein
MNHRAPAAVVVFLSALMFCAMLSCRTLQPPAPKAVPAAPAVGPGDAAIFAEAALVRVRNLEPLDAKTGYFVFNDECLALDGGRIIAVAVHDGRVLVRYEPPKQKFYGSCPAGTLFFIAADDFAGMTAKYHRKRAELDAERELVERLLGQAPAP